MAKVLVVYDQPTNKEGFDGHYYGTHIPLAEKLPDVSPVQARAAIDAMLTLNSETEAVSKIKDTTIAVDNGEINIRIYTPEGTGPFPLFVYYHGGGYVIGNLDFVDHVCRSIANAGNCVVVSAE